MKKLLTLLALLIPTGVFAGYYDVQQYKVVPNTTTIRNDWYYRGSMHIVKSTSIVDAASCPIMLSFSDDGTIVGSVSTATYADNAGALNGYAYAHFVNTTTVQSISGNKTFTDEILANGNIKLQDGDFIYVDSDFNSYITGTNDVIDMYIDSSLRIHMGTDKITLRGEYVHIGDAGTTNYVSADGDAYVENQLEVDGLAYFTGVGTASIDYVDGGGDVYIRDELEVDTTAQIAYANIPILDSNLITAPTISFTIGSTEQGRFVAYDGDDHLKLGLNSLNAKLILTNMNNINKAHNIAPSQVHPTLVLYGSGNVDIDDTRYAYMYHDNSDFHITSYTGDVKIDDNIIATGYEITADTFTGTFIGSASTATYANDSDLLDGYNYDYFLDTTTAASTYWATQGWEQYFIKESYGINVSTKLASDIIDVSSITSSGIIYLIPSGTSVDYLQLYTSGGKPRFRIIGGNLVQFESDGSLVGLDLDYGGSSFQIWKETSLSVLKAETPLDIRTNNDGDDYIKITTVGNQTTLRFVGQDGLITADDGIIDFDDENLTTTGEITASTFTGVMVGTATYANDSDRLDNQEGTYYLARVNHTGTQTISTLSDHNKSNHDALNIDADTLDGYNYDYFLDTTTAAATYLGISAKAADSDLLDSYDYTHFVDTITNQTIDGLKSFGTGTQNYVDGTGDVYIADELEVDGISRFADDVYFLSGANTYFDARVNFQAVDVILYDNVEFITGNSLDFSLGYSSTDDEFRILKGNNVATDANVALSIDTSTNVAVNNNLTVGTTAFYVDTTNYRVGIGTTTPQRTLHLNSGGDHTWIRMDNSNSGWLIGAEGGVGTDRIVFWHQVTNDYKMIISSEGYVGIQDEYPDAQLEILSESGPSEYIVAVSSQDDITGNIFTILGNGNVGIGITNPSVKLHVFSDAIVDTKVVQWGTSGYYGYLSFDYSGTAAIRMNTAGGGGPPLLLGSEGIDNVVIDDNIVVIGTTTASGYGALINYVDGDGDLYIRDELEVDGTATMANIDSKGYIWMTKDGGIFYAGYAVADGDWYLQSHTGSGWQDIFHTVSGTLEISTSIVTSPLYIGSGGSIDYVDGDGDLYVKDELEVDGTIRASGTILNQSNDEPYIMLWNGSSYDFRIAADLTMNQGEIFIGSDIGKQIVIAEAQWYSSDFDHAPQTSPTLYIHSEQDPDVDNSQWISISYSSSTDTANFDVGGASVSFNMSGFNVPNMLIGTTQATAGASAGELWADSDDDYTIKLGQ